MVHNAKCDGCGKPLAPRFGNPVNAGEWCQGMDSGLHLTREVLIALNLPSGQLCDECSNDERAYHRGMRHIAENWYSLIVGQHEAEFRRWVDYWRREHANAVELYRGR